MIPMKSNFDQIDFQLMHHESDQLKEELVREQNRQEDLRKSLRLSEEAKNRVQSESNKQRMEIENLNVKLKVNFAMNSVINEPK